MTDPKDISLKKTKKTFKRFHFIIQISVVFKPGKSVKM